MTKWWGVPVTSDHFILLKSVLIQNKDMATVQYTESAHSQLGFSLPHNKKSVLISVLTVLNRSTKLLNASNSILHQLAYICIEHEYEIHTYITHCENTIFPYSFHVFFSDKTPIAIYIQ